jgi:hypothetical protein
MVPLVQEFFLGLDTNVSLKENVFERFSAEI